jgi:hypothetical protein
MQSTRKRKAERRANSIFRPKAEVRGISTGQGPQPGANGWILDRTPHEAAVRSAADGIIREASNRLVHTSDPMGDDSIAAIEVAVMLREAALLCDVLRFLDSREGEE